MPKIIDKGGNSVDCADWEFAGDALILRNSADAELKHYQSENMKGFRFFDNIKAMTANTFNAENVYAVGSTLAVDEAYTSTPMNNTLVCHWERSADKETWADISGATSETYTLTEDDYGKYVRRVAYATGDTYGAINTIASTAILGLLVSASVTGTAQVSETLTAAPVLSPVGCSTPTYSYQWMSCDTVDGTYVDIESATSATYTLTSGEEGKYIKVAITATVEALGSVVSTATAVVAAAA